ncbi:hypothetical protein HD554DRAFT_2037207 [Boletus coccyginus]|nr:hypothetical protein HD554DRAFT_2037207 [Boletus coccyginus]
MLSPPSWKSASAAEMQFKNKKHKTDELLNALTNTSTKKSKKSSNEDGNDMKIYRITGKKATALLDPFAVPMNAFIIGVQHDKCRNINDLTPEANQCHLHFYNGIQKLVPSLRGELDTITPKHLHKIIQVITKGISDGRFQDLSAVKYKGLKYVPFNMSEALAPSITDSEDKSMHGVFHPQLARLMCPHWDVEEFDADPVVGMEALQQGVLLMKSSRWPMLFYDEAACDLNDIQAGLLQHHAIKQIYQHLFDGLATVNGDTFKKAKQAKNGAWSLELVDSHIIAYWTWMIGKMDLQDTYWHIIEVLDDKSDPWVGETLKRWNRQDKAAASLKHVNNALDDSKDDMAEIHA